MTRDDVISELRSTAVNFNPALKQFVTAEIQDTSLLEKVLYAVDLIGERERPFLVRLSAELTGGTFADAMPLALATELFISAALTGDDLIDEAPIRWGKPTVSRTWSFGDALLVAEILHSLANRSISLLFNNCLDENVRTVCRIQNELQLVFRGLLVWQHRESSLTGVLEVNEQQCIDLAYERTGRLLELSLSSPAILNRADADTINSLSTFGRLFGTAFQLRDDLIDFIGEEDVIGKPIMADLKNGQPNIVLSHFFAEATDVDRQSMMHWWNRDAGAIDNEQVLALCIRSGSLEHALRVIERICSEARESLKDLPSSYEQLILAGLADVVSDFPVVWM